MIRKLLVIFASAAAIAFAGIALAWSLGGPEFRQGFGEDGKGWNWSSDKDYTGPRKSREFAIDGSSLLTMAVPVDLHFTRGDTPKMIVQGPADAIDRLTWTGQRLALTGSGGMRHSLDVTIVAPMIKALEVESAANVDLAALDQDELNILSSGAIDLEGFGRVKRLAIDAAGASDIDLKRLDVTDATVSISGAGDVELAASGKVDIAISGAGEVTLHRKPQVLHKTISGFGSVNEAFATDTVHQ